MPRPPRGRRRVAHRLRFARWAAYETGSWVPGASDTRGLYIDLSTARRGPVGAPVFASSVRVWQIGCFAIWAFSSPQDVAPGAQPGRNLSRPQLPPCQVL